MAAVERVETSRQSTKERWATRLRGIGGLLIRKDTDSNPQATNAPNSAPQRSPLTERFLETMPPPTRTDSTNQGIDAQLFKALDFIRTECSGTAGSQAPVRMLNRGDEVRAGMQIRRRLQSNDPTLAEDLERYTQVAISHSGISTGNGTENDNDAKNITVYTDVQLTYTLHEQLSDHSDIEHEYREAIELALATQGFALELQAAKTTDQPTTI